MWSIRQICGMSAGRLVGQGANYLMYRYVGRRPRVARIMFVGIGTSPDRLVILTNCNPGLSHYGHGTNHTVARFIANNSLCAPTELGISFSGERDPSGFIGL